MISYKIVYIVNEFTKACVNAYVFASNEAVSIKMKIDRPTYCQQFPHSLDVVPFFLKLIDKNYEVYHYYTDAKKIR